MLVGHTFDPADSGDCRKRGIPEVIGDLGICPVSEQELQKFEIAGLRRTHERRGAGLEEPLIRKDGPRFGVVGDLGVRICAASPEGT